MERKIKTDCEIMARCTYKNGTIIYESFTQYYPQSSNKALFRR